MTDREDIPPPIGESLVARIRREQRELNEHAADVLRYYEEPPAYWNADGFSIVEAESAQSVWNARLEARIKPTRWQRITRTVRYAWWDVRDWVAERLHDLAYWIQP